MAEGIDLKMKVSGANKVQRELKQTGKAARGMGAGVNKAGAAMGGMAAAINPVTAGLAVAAAGFVAVAVAAKVTKDAFIGTIKATLKLADELDTITKKAQSIGATNTDIQLVSNAMALFGVETSQTIKATQKFNQALGQAMLPDAPKTLLAAFDRLGMSARELAEMPLRERFIKISEGFATYENQATRAADASLLFGRMGKDALTAFSQGGEAMAAAVEDVERYGLASDQAFKNAEELVDAQFRLDLAFKGLKTDALEPLMPVLQGVAQGLADILAGLDRGQVNDYGEAMADMTERVVSAMVAAGPALEFAAKSLEFFGKASEVVVSGFLNNLDRLTWWKDMFGLDEATGLRDSSDRWSAWGDDIISAIRAAREEAQGPVFGPHLPDPDDMPMQGAALPPGYVAPRRRRRKSRPTKAPAKVTDPLAGLKKELEAIRRVTADKELLMDESLAAQRENLLQGIEANLISEQQAMAQDIALTAAHDAKLLEMADAQAARMLQISEAQAAAQKAIEDKAAEERRQIREAEEAAVLAVIGTVGTFAGEISGLLTELGGEQNKEAKEAAKVFFGIQQASAIAGAIVNTALSVTSALATPPFPLGAALAVTAGAAGAAQIATITATTIKGMAHAGLPPGALGPGPNEATIMMRRDEMILDPVGTRAISQMLNQRTGGGQPIQVSTVLELDGDVLGRTVDNHLVRSSERGTSYQDRIRY